MDMVRPTKDTFVQAGDNREESDFQNLVKSFRKFIERNQISIHQNKSCPPEKPRLCSE